ncbi:MAG: thiol-disulfide oxidoreductase DCC family protein [Ferruginibacter sp.]
MAIHDSPFTIHHPIILFDGVCNLCNHVVQFVIRHDKKSLFRFASLQGEQGQQLLMRYKLSSDDFNSFVLIQNNKAYTKSLAALLVAKQLNAPLKFLYGFIIVPPFIRNTVYNIIARKRYRWFGKKDECMIPTPALKERFLN